MLDWPRGLQIANATKRQETMLHQNTLTQKQWFNNVLHLYPVPEEGAMFNFYPDLQFS